MICQLPDNARPARAHAEHAERGGDHRDVANRAVTRTDPNGRPVGDKRNDTGDAHRSAAGSVSCTAIRTHCQPPWRLDRDVLGECCPHSPRQCDARDAESASALREADPAVTPAMISTLNVTALLASAIHRTRYQA